MDTAGARVVLGIAADATWPAVRAQYRVLIRRHHPDNATDLADIGLRTVRTAQITEAFAVLLAIQTAQELGVDSAPPAPATPSPKRPGRSDAHLGASFRHPTVGVDDTRVVLLDAAPMDAFLALHEAFSMIGAVSYIDRLSLVVEAIVVPEPGRATSLLAWLDAGPEQATTATLCVESLGGHPPADLDALVDRVAELLASPRPPASSA
ncbi:MAG: J domain-containing protein [Acidimicrobiia bacterium]|nr:J domain-containing protein [Acidimicrobiia bacterium]